MNILHITNDYSGSTVYKNLIGKLDNLGVAQIVYNPIRDSSRLSKNKIKLSVSKSEIIYSHILDKITDRIFYRRKIKKIFKDLEKQVDLSKVNVIHAHTWYSDGGVAYLLSKKYNIPYVVTIRNSDLNVFQKYLVHERSFGKRIIEKSKKVILISASYRKRILNLTSLSAIEKGLYSKLQIIPNGVDLYWIDNVLEVTKENDLENKIVNLLFVGKFVKGKNVLPLQLAVNDLNKENKKAHLHLVGGGGAMHKKILKQVDLNGETMTYHGKVYNKLILKTLYRNADVFTMPSSHETFGLVYVEAMLQGLPILYTKNEGIDGFYTEKIGEKVTSNKVEEIKKALERLIKNHRSYDLPVNKLKKNHSWCNIAKVYKDIYINVTKDK